MLKKLLHIKPMKFLRGISVNFTNLSGLSCKILIIGHAVLCAYMMSVFIFMLKAGAEVQGLTLIRACQISEMMVEQILAALCVLWGGALFIDYLHMRQRLP